MKQPNVKKMVTAALLLAIGMVLPFFTGQIKEIGNMLLPMHLPVMLCGLICGWQYGLAVGLVLPLLRSVSFGMPVLYPTAVSMAFELATYGFVIGLMYGKSRWKWLSSLYISLLSAMICGRLVWGGVQCVLLGVKGFTFRMFLAGALLNAIPGIVLQLILIPAIMLLLHRKEKKDATD